MNTRTAFRINEKTKDNQKGYAVGIPAHMGRMLEEAKITAFDIEFTEEGIILRPVIDNSPVLQELPSWLTPSTKS